MAIARAMVNHPQILLADEPTGSLDSRSGEQVMELFRELNREGVSILMITHDPGIGRPRRQNPGDPGRKAQRGGGKMKKKRVLAGVLCAVLALGAGLGITAGVRVSGRSRCWW